MIKLLSQSDFNQLKTSLYPFNIKIKTIMTFLMYTGLRAGELTQLQYGDITFHNQTPVEIRIRPQATKTGFARTVPIPPQAVGVIREFLDSFIPSDASPIPTAYLFPGSGGNPHISVHGIEQIVDRVCKQTINKHVTPHYLRHTYATMLLKYSNTREVQLLLGHKKLSSTQVYTHPNILDLTKTVKKAFS